MLILFLLLRVYQLFLLAALLMEDILRIVLLILLLLFFFSRFFFLRIFSSGREKRLLINCGRAQNCIWKLSGDQHVNLVNVFVQEPLLVYFKPDWRRARVNEQVERLHKIGLEMLRVQRDVFCVPDNMPIHHDFDENSGLLDFLPFTKVAAIFFNLPVSWMKFTSSMTSSFNRPFFSTYSFWFFSPIESVS